MPSPPSPVRTHIQHAVAFTATMLVSELFIYGQLIVPALVDIPRVPLSWWAGMYAPVLLVLAWMSTRLRTGRDFAGSVLLMALLTQAVKVALAVMGAPGHHKSTALEDAAAFWTVFMARVALGYAVLLGLCVAVARAWKRMAPSRE